MAHHRQALVERHRAGADRYEGRAAIAGAIGLSVEATGDRHRPAPHHGHRARGNQRGGTAEIGGLHDRQSPAQPAVAAVRELSATRRGEDVLSDRGDAIERSKELVRRLHLFEVQVACLSLEQARRGRDPERPLGAGGRGQPGDVRRLEARHPFGHLHADVKHALGPVAEEGRASVRDAHERGHQAVQVRVKERAAARLTRRRCELEVAAVGAHHEPGPGEEERRDGVGVGALGGAGRREPVVVAHLGNPARRRGARIERDDGRPGRSVALLPPRRGQIRARQIATPHTAGRPRPQLERARRRGDRLNGV